MSIYVIMPVYNGGKYLKDAIDSILNQSYNDFTLLIINDCSSDNSHEIILSYNDSRIQYIVNEQNLRLAKTLNKAIKLASNATYIFRMDQDDISHPDRLLFQKKFLDQYPDIGVVGSRMKIIDSLNVIDYPVGSDLVKVHLLTYNPLGHPTVAIRAAFFKKYNLWYRDDIYT